MNAMFAAGGLVAVLLILGTVAQTKHVERTRARRVAELDALRSKLPMNWVLDADRKEMVEINQGYRLLRESGGSDGSISFKMLDGSGEVCCVFDADRGGRTKISDDVVRACAIDKNEISVWRILCWPDEWRGVIKSAMLAYKSLNGWQYPGSATYVQFGVYGLLESDLAHVR